MPASSNLNCVIADALERVVNALNNYPD